MSVRTKSPLHPSALSVNDLNLGRRIIRFSSFFGNVGEYIVLRQPYIRTETWGRKLVVDLRDVEDGTETSMFLEDMGVVPYSSGWSKVHFTVDHRKRNLLPVVRTIDADARRQWEETLERWERDYEDELEKESYINSLY